MPAATLFINPNLGSTHFSLRIPYEQIKVSKGKTNERASTFLKTAECKFKTVRFKQELFVILMSKIQIVTDVFSTEYAYMNIPEFIGNLWISKTT
jgi:hypothetical protein